MPALFFSILTPIALPTFVCFFILFHSCRSRAQVFRKTLVHEFPVSYCHTEWNLFSLCEGRNNWKRSSIKQVLLLLLLFPCCSSVYFCCSHALCHCVKVSLVIRMFMSILYSNWFIWDRHVCVSFGLSPDLPSYSYLPEKHPFACGMGLLWSTLLYLFWCWSFLCISLKYIYIYIYSVLLHCSRTMWLLHRSVCSLPAPFVK